MKERKCPIIAVVDDEEPVRIAVQRLLRSADFLVETFASGIEFLESLETHRPDCVVLDLHMPRLDGFAVQSRVNATRLRLPVVIITGHDSDENRQRSLAGGARACLGKPVDEQALLDAIAAAIASTAGKDVS